MSSPNDFPHRLDMAKAYVHAAITQLDDALALSEARLLNHKHYRLLQTTRNNLRRHDRILRKLIPLAWEAVNPHLTIPGFDQFTPTPQQMSPTSPRPHNSQPDRSE